MVLPYRNPFVVAKAGATLDVLSGGRFTLAAGVGYLRSEFVALGVDPDERNELFDEALEVLRAVWTGDDGHPRGPPLQRPWASPPDPRPLSRPHPPIWIGGNSAAARRRVADPRRRVGTVPRPGHDGGERRDHGAGHARAARGRDRRPAGAARGGRAGPGLGRHHLRLPGRRRTRRRTTSTPTPTSPASTSWRRWASPGSRSGSPGDSRRPARWRPSERYGEQVIAGAPRPSGRSGLMAFGPGDVAGRTASRWSTGGGAGIGRGIAAGLAAFGAQVVGRERDPTSCAAAAAEVAGLGCVADVRDEAQVDEALDRTVAELGVPQILINNAGGVFESSLLPPHPGLGGVAGGRTWPTSCCAPSASRGCWSPRDSVGAS